MKNNIELAIVLSNAMFRCKFCNRFFFLVHLFMEFLWNTNVVFFLLSLYCVFCLRYSFHATHLLWKWVNLCQNPESLIGRLIIWSENNNLAKKWKLVYKNGYYFLIDLSLEISHFEQLKLCLCFCCWKLDKVMYGTRFYVQIYWMNPKKRANINGFQRDGKKVLLWHWWINLMR